MQGGMSLIDICKVDVIRTIIHFLHQVLIILGVFIIFDLPFSQFSLISVLGLGILIINGFWLTVFFGIVGARYRDLTEVITAIMRIAFLATPIIWLPLERGSGGIMGAFLTYNPFYHYLDLIRAPLMGNDISPTSIAVVAIITCVGGVFTFFFYRRLHFRVPLWI